MLFDSFSQIYEKCFEMLNYPAEHHMYMLKSMYNNHFGSLQVVEGKSSKDNIIILTDGNREYELYLNSKSLSLKPVDMNFESKTLSFINQNDGSAEVYVCSTSYDDGCYYEKINSDLNGNFEYTVEYYDQKAVDYYVSQQIAQEQVVVRAKESTNRDFFAKYNLLPDAKLDAKCIYLASPGYTSNYTVEKKGVTYSSGRYDLIKEAFWPIYAKCDAIRQFVKFDEMIKEMSNKQTK